MGYLDENGLQRYHSGIKTALANKADLDDIVALPNQAGTYILKAVSQNGTITYTWDTTKLTILRYGSSTWADFIEAYSTNSIVYCRASSNANPSTGLQGRMAFMAYLNSDTNPTEVEFQYYRSVNQHSATQQGDQMYVYKLTSANKWTVTVRESYTKIVAGTKMSSSYSNGALTLNFDGHDLPSGGTTGQVLKKTSGTDYDVSWSDSCVIVNNLPVSGEIGIMYLIPKSVANVGSAIVDTAELNRIEHDNAYDKYIYINNSFEKISSDSVANDDEIATMLDAIGITELGGE